MKTWIYKCSDCNAVEFRDSFGDGGGEVCGIVRFYSHLTPDKVTADTAMSGVRACAGIMEYYAYSDFERWK